MLPKLELTVDSITVIHDHRSTLQDSLFLDERNCMNCMRGYFTEYGFMKVAGMQMQTIAVIQGLIAFSKTPLSLVTFATVFTI